MALYAITLKPFSMVPSVDPADPIIVDADQPLSSSMLATLVCHDECSIVQGEDLLDPWAFEYERD